MIDLFLDEIKSKLRINSFLKICTNNILKVTNEIKHAVCNVYMGFCTLFLMVKAFLTTFQL
ncbi:hypothetical protein CW733_11705 [Lacinutrix sp. Bg11-31]|nr:hypothetical protein CW733_11705 [Lacinutrix sp. Bg11-31]